MPIFQDDLGGGRGTPPAKQTTPPLLTTPPERNTIIRKLSEESIRTELCDGPIPDTPEDPREPLEELKTSFTFPLHGTSDRVELIERLKKGESPTWLPNRNVSYVS